MDDIIQQILDNELIFSAKNGESLEKIEKLLIQGANPVEKDIYGYSALDYARLKKYHTIANRIREEIMNNLENLDSSLEVNLNYNCINKN